MSELHDYVNKMSLQDRITSVQDMWETYIVATTKMPQNGTSARLTDAILGACFELQGEVMHPTAWLRSHGVDVDGGAE